MADLTIRRSPGTLQQQQPTPSRELEPFRLMRELMGWDPFGEMTPRWPSALPGTNFAPAFEVKETPDAYLFRADVPGIKESDLDVTLVSNRLTVSGRREEEKEEEGERYYAYERSYGGFSRSFTLPEGADVDHIQADLRSGVLSIAIPKRAEIQPKKVTVKSQEKSPKV